MLPVSVVIITKNEADKIGACLKSAAMITDDIVVIDNGSTDDTLKIARTFGCRVFENAWNGYGANKNKGLKMARHNWILSLDADEVPDMELILSLYQLTWDNAAVAYDIKYRSYFGSKLIKHGRWGRDHHIRLFNRQLVRWSETRVHERLVIPQNIRVDRLEGNIRHYSVSNAQECSNKAVNYAMLSAESYFQSHKKYSFINLYLSPVFGFLVDYILFMGMLDGKEGFEIARCIYKNKKLKYRYLAQLEGTRGKSNFNNVLVAEC